MNNKSLYNYTTNINYMEFKTDIKIKNYLNIES